MGGDDSTPPPAGPGLPPPTTMPPRQPLFGSSLATPPPPASLAGVPTPLLVGELERRLYCREQPSRNVVLIGKPGSGKGTVAKKIEDKHCLCHIGLGDLLRAEQRAGTLLGKRVERRVERGQLVEDDTALFLLQREMARPECAKGFVLDGLPRSVTQARQLDSFLRHAGLGIDKVIDLEVSDTEAQRRLEHRLVHPPSGRVYNEQTMPPRVPFTDDVTGEPLARRADDVEDKLRRSDDDEWGSLARRLAVWREEAGRVLAYYQRQEKLAVVKAEAPPEEVFRRVEAALEGTGRKATEEKV